MNASKGLYAIVLVLAVCLAGCSHGGTPVAPGPEEILNSVSADAGNSHALWGMYTFVCDPESQSVDIITLRDAGMHLNALKLLEPPPNLHLRIEGPPVIAGGILDVDIGLLNPYPGLTIYTGFDVCGIVFTHGSYSGYNDPEIVTAGEGDTRLLNADGCSRWWNPAEFPHVDTIFAYKDGLLGTPAGAADFNCTVNGYKLFADGLGPDDPLTALDPALRGMFSAGLKRVRHYTIDLDGGLIFNYAVDACWKKPLGSPPYIPPDDFPKGANRPEAYNIVVEETLNNLYYDEYTGGGGELRLLIDVYDHFNAGLNVVSAEALAGLPHTVSSSPIGGGGDFSTYELDFTGIDLTANGDTELFVTVRSEASDYGGLLPGKPVCAYFNHTFNIREKLGWAVTWGGNAAEHCLKLAADEAGNVYSTGSFSSSNVDFDPGPGETVRSPIGLVDAYLVKFDPLGNFQWVNTWGGAGTLVTGIDTEVGSSWDVYVLGTFESTVDFNPGTGEDYHSSNGERDVFLCKFDKDGAYYGTYTWGGEGEEGTWGLTEDQEGNIYAAGWFRFTVDFDPGPGIDEHNSPEPSQSGFLSKFDSIGNYSWVVTWEALEGVYSSGGVHEVCVDNSGNIFVTGGFSGTYDLNPGPGIEEHTSHSEWADPFLCKLDEYGNFLWAATWGGVQTDYGAAVDTDNLGNVYASGSFYDTVDFDPGPGVDEHTHDGAYEGTYLSKFGPDGDYQWVRVHDYGNGYALVVDNLDYVHIAYGYWGGYLVKYDQQGTEQWSRMWGWGKHIYCYGLAADGNNNVFVSGEFHDKVDFDPGPGIDKHTPQGATDAYIIKFLPTGYW